MTTTTRTKAYYALEEDVVALRRVMKRLYTEDRMSGDEMRDAMRDAAHTLRYAIEQIEKGEIVDYADVVELVNEANEPCKDANHAYFISIGFPCSCAVSAVRYTP